MLRKGKTCLDPVPIRDIIVNKEKQRILKGNIAPANRLFDLGLEEVFEESNLVMDPRGIQRLGQQDCRDFFICIIENREHWEDVFNLFKIGSVNYTSCSLCNHVSEQDQSMLPNAFFLFEVPEENVTVSAFIEGKLNFAENVFGWKDEDGCKKKTVGKYHTKIKDMRSIDCIIIILNRLIKVDDNLEIVRRKVPLGINISLTDVNGLQGVFMPIAIIHHSGNVTGNTTEGHYQADVLDSHSRQWIRTSDDDLPVKIDMRSVTDQGYIYLYKKIN